jgi:hypothetical protein
MNLPDNPRLQNLTKEQLLRLISTHFFLVNKRDIVHAIYDVEMDRWQKESAIAVTNLQKCKCGDKPTVEQFYSHQLLWLKLNKKCDAINKKFDKILAWYKKQNAKETD